MSTATDRRHGRMLGDGDADARLADLGLHWTASGQAGLRGPLLELADDCDRAFRRIAALWDAREERHAATLPASVLQRVDYLRSFPQQATFPVNLAPGDANLGGFVGGPVLNAAGDVTLAELDAVQDVLTPAACYHLYAAHEGESFDAPSYLTTRNTCFRRESHYVPLRRLRSFTMREIVCVGSQSEAKTFVGAARDVLELVLATIDLPAPWQPATDPFFRPRSSPQHLFQRLHPVKHEATYRGDLAIGSVNLHQDHFGVAFELERAGGPAHTACLAFGIERWLFAIVDRHGADPASWPRVADAAAQVVDTMGSRPV